MQYLSTHPYIPCISRCLTVSREDGSIEPMIDAEIAKKIRPGAKVRVWERIKEGDKERQSAFEGIVIAHKHGVQAGATFTVRSILQEVGVEKVYPLQTPIIAKVEIISAAKKVRRSKLYYLRDLSNKKVREKLKVSL